MKRDAKQKNWDRRFLALAQHVAEWSVDPTTKVGCVIVGPTKEVRVLGYNGLPREVETTVGRLERPVKYVWIEHAERNAIYAAARTGIALDGCRMYLSWFPCIECARAVVQAGIRELVAIEPDWTSQPWGPQFVKARGLLSEGNVSVQFLTPD
jgi:dCMP deaminase